MGVEATRPLGGKGRAEGGPRGREGTVLGPPPYPPTPHYGAPTILGARASVFEDMTAGQYEGRSQPGGGICPPCHCLHNTVTVPPASSAVTTPLSSSQGPEEAAHCQAGDCSLQSPGRCRTRSRPGTEQRGQVRGWAPAGSTARAGAPAVPPLRDPRARGTPLSPLCPCLYGRVCPEDTSHETEGRRETRLAVSAPACGRAPPPVCRADVGADAGSFPRRGTLAATWVCPGSPLRCHGGMPPACSGASEALRQGTAR